MLLMKRQVRTIKFRAWDGKRMTTSGIMFNCSLGLLETPNGAQMKLMQFTGLTDKNGVEIFESDLVKTNYGNTGLVEFLNGSFKLVDIETGQKLGFGTYAKKSEVISNIYEPKDQ